MKSTHPKSIVFNPPKSTQSFSPFPPRQISPKSFSTQDEIHSAKNHPAKIFEVSIRLKYWPLHQHNPEREALVWVIFQKIVSQNNKKQFLSAVLLVKAPIENKQNTSKQVKFESSHVRIIHKPRTRDRGQYLSLIKGNLIFSKS